MVHLFAGVLLWLTPVSLPSLVVQGDQDFVRMQYPEAEASYEEALGTTPDSADVLWRLARVVVCIADVSPEDRKLDLYRQAEVFARRSVEADSTRPEGHTWHAAALGSIAMFEGGKTKVKLCYDIKQELDTSIRLNPNDDVAYSILGSYYMALGSVTWIERQLAAVFIGRIPEGGYVEAERALRKAIALAPNVIRHHAELGDLYIREGRKPEALEQFRLVTALPVLLARDRGEQDRAARMVKEFAGE